MKKNQPSLHSILMTLLNPNATETELDNVLQQLADLDQAKGLPPLEQRPKNKKAVCTLLARQSPDTSLAELEHYLDHYYKSIEVARLVARHPNIDMWWLARFSYFLPTDAKANPMYAQHSQSENWASLIDQKPTEAKPGSWSRSYESFKRFTIHEDRPHYFKIPYWLENGTSADKRHIAGLNRVDESLLQPLIKEKSAPVRKALAQRKKPSQALASSLAQDQARTVRQALAENPACPPEVLEVLSRDDHELVKQAALNNSACPSEAVQAAKFLEQLTPEPDQVPTEQLDPSGVIDLIGDEETTAEQLQVISKHSEACFRSGVALHRNCPTDLLNILSNDNNFGVKLSVAFNPNTEKDTLQKLLDLNDERYHMALATNPSLSEQQQLTLVDQGSEEIRLALANTTESVVVWQALRDSEPKGKQKKSSKNKTWRECIDLCLDPKAKGLYAFQRSTKYRYSFVNKLIARHPLCPKSLYANYAFYCFSSLAQNPELTLLLLENPNAIKAEEYAEWKVLEWLKWDEIPGHVARHYLHHNHPKITRKVVQSKAALLVDIQPHVYDEDIHIRKNIAVLEQCTPFMFGVLAHDEKESVRAAVINNPNCPADVLTRLSEDPVAAIRVSAQSHPNFKKATGGKKKIESLKNKGTKANRIKQAKTTQSLKVMRDLVEDQSTAVRKELAARKKAPLDILEKLQHDQDTDIRALVAAHRNASLEIHQHLVNDKQESVRFHALSGLVYHAAIHNPDESKPTYSELLYDENLFMQYQDDPSDTIRAFIAQRSTHDKIHRTFLSDSSEKVTKALARNPSISQSIAEALLKQEQQWVTQTLCRYTPHVEVFLKCMHYDQWVASTMDQNDSMMEVPEVLHAMVRHSNPVVRRHAAYRVTDPSDIDLLVHDEAYEITEVIAGNKLLNEEQIEHLLLKADMSLAESMTYYQKKYFKKHLSSLLKHSNPCVRAAIPRNLKLSNKAITELIADPSPSVRSAVISSSENKLTPKHLSILKNDMDKSVQSYLTTYYPKL